MLENCDDSFIEITPIPSGDQNRQSMRIRGKFTVNPELDMLSVNEAEVLKHIVLVVTRSGNYQSVTPFEKIVTFKDDIKVEGDTCSGFFNVDVFEHIQFDGAGDYYILCSLGAVTSNILKFFIPSAQGSH